MPDNPTPNDTIDSKTRANLAYIFSISSILMLSYILYEWGGQKEILTLIIGLIGGTLLGSVSGVYFGGSTLNKKPDNSSITGTGPIVNITPKPDTDNEKPK
jgi:hypothetical protein